jgi:succinate-semialdehyde dehydrogenase/glutarate-semialdehyde dehydrogenase
MNTQGNPFGLQDPALLRRQLYVDGRWQGGDAQPIPVENPATGEGLGAVDGGSPAMANAAADAAHRALSGWAALTAQERGDFLMRWHALILENRADLARIMTIEQGKPLAEAEAEVRYGASFVKWFAEEGRRAYGEIVPPPQKGTRLLVLRQPVGVCAAITPWNFPCAMILRKAAPALAAGCPIVIKPAEATPFSALALAELAARAQLPAGVFNIVLGEPAPIGEAFSVHPAVRKISFTGSTRTGKLLLAQAARQVQKATMELGGNAPFIVFGDADFEAAVDGAIAARFRNAGQVCVAANRILVHESLYARFGERLAERVSALRVGNGLDPETQVGPLINAAAMERVSAMVVEAKAQGATILAGGKPHPAGALFFEPTLIAGASRQSRLWREEIFGPAITLTPFATDEEAIELANDTEYGLAAYFYSQGLARTFRVAEALQFGMVGINSPSVSGDAVPFGGIKASGLGREGSRHGIEDYLEYKALYMGGM